MTLVDSDTSGVTSRDRALLMRSHKFQSLGDACLTEGVDPGVKYRNDALMPPSCLPHDSWMTPS